MLPVLRMLKLVPSGNKHRSRIEVLFTNKRLPDISARPSQDIWISRLTV